MQVEQLAAVQNLASIIEANPRIKLVIMDSVAFHFRHGTSDFGQRTRLLTSMAQQLNDLAHRFNCAIVLMNQMTTRVDKGQGAATGAGGSGGTARLVPALGESWAHAATHRLQLFWSVRSESAEDWAGLDVNGINGIKATRHARLIKSSSRASGIVDYDVCTLGIRDPGHSALPPQRSSSSASATASASAPVSAQMAPHHMPSVQSMQSMPSHVQQAPAGQQYAEQGQQFSTMAPMAPPPETDPKRQRLT